MKSHAAISANSGTFLAPSGLMHVLAKTLMTIALMVSGPVWASDGANHGGGGGTLAKLGHPTADQVFGFIRSRAARAAIDQWINGLDNKSSEGFRSNSLPVQPQDLRNITSLLKIQLPTKSACLDSDRSKDGSVVSKSNNTICLSIGRIVKHSTSADYQARVLSLIMHEITHLILGGPAEQQAVQVEMAVYKDMIEVDWQTFNSPELVPQLDRIAARLSSAKNFSGYQSTTSACNATSSLYYSLRMELVTFAPESMAGGSWEEAATRERAIRSPFRFFPAKFNPMFKAWSQTADDLWSLRCSDYHIPRTEIPAELQTALTQFENQLREVVQQTQQSQYGFELIL